MDERITRVGGSGMTPPRQHGLRVAGSDADELDALAELFLGGDAPPAGRDESPTRRRDGTQRASRRPAIEALLLGHLPVRAGMWVRPYAAGRLASAGEPVALLRRGDGRTTLDLLGVRGAPPAEGDLDAAITTAAEHARRWIVRVDSDEERALLDADGVTRVTVLSGADEAALVASYRLLKSLAARIDESGDDGPALRVAIMGAGETETRRSVEKIRRAATAFLGREIEVVAGPSRVCQVLSSPVFHGPDSQPIGTIVRQIGALEHNPASRGVDRTQHSSRAERRTERAPSRPLRLAGSAFEARPAAGPRPGTEGGPARELTPAEATPAARPEPAPRRTPGSNPPGRWVREPRGLAEIDTAVLVERPGTLAALVPGLISLETKCPAAPGLELAADERGRLHLLTLGATSAACGDALRDLLVGEAWIRDHLPLLLRAERSLATPDPDRHAPAHIAHVLTGDASSAAKLVPTRLRVHLLTRVRPADGSNAYGGVISRELR